MDKVSIIIPVHNLIKRGLQRVRNSVISLNYQRDFIKEIVVVNSSDKIQYDMLNNLLVGLNVKHIHYPLKYFNKPKLLNKGITETVSKYIMCTDSDYIFKSDFLFFCAKYRKESNIIFKQVKMLPNTNITDDKIKSWTFPKAGFNIWGKIANGACQYATREFFINNPYPEIMDGFSAMDNFMAYVAYNKGLSHHWLIESEILHQHHAIENKMAGENRVKFERNQQMMQDYISKYNLPCLLSK